MAGDFKMGYVRMSVHQSEYFDRYVLDINISDEFDASLAWPLSTY